MGKDWKDKKKKYYVQANKPPGKGKHNFKTISFGSKGIICTSDKHHQKFCGMEARYILQERFEKRYGHFNSSNSSEVDVATDDENEPSLTEMLQKEIEDAKKQTNSSSSDENPIRLWEFTDTKCTGVEFLELNPLAYDMMKKESLTSFLTSIFTSESLPTSRHIRRMIPLEVVFQATAANLKSEVIKLVHNLVYHIVVEEKKQFIYKIEVYN